MFRVTEMFACRVNSCTTFTSSPFPLKSVGYVCRNVCQPKWPTIPRVLFLASQGIFPIVSKSEHLQCTRSRVSFFKNRFRKLGFVDYGEGGLQVHSSLLNIVLHD